MAPYARFGLIAAIVGAGVAALVWWLTPGISVTVAAHPALVVALLTMLVVAAGVLPGYGAGMVIGQHGSWNRAKLSGYRVIHVPFAGGRPAGPPRDILDGFLSPDEREAWGRPVGVAVGPDGRSLLVADDVGNAVWRVSGA